jgi:hypothetical protein
LPRRGETRIRGYLVTQRLPAISKDILGQCPNGIFGRVDQALDRRAAADSLGFVFSSEEAKGLLRLKN